MAVNLTMGFEDQYSRGLQEVIEALEQQEQRTRESTKATQQQNDALREMARQHEDVARAMLRSGEASGSLTMKATRVDLKTREMGKSADGSGMAFAALAGKLGTAAAALKIIETGLSATGKSADGSINNWVRLKTATVTTLETGVDLMKMFGRSLSENVAGVEQVGNQLTRLAKPWADAFRIQDLEIINKQIADFQRGLNETLQLEGQLHRVGTLQTKEAVQKALDAELKKREQIKGTNLWTKQNIRTSFEMESALRHRLVDVARETEQKKVEAQRKAIQDAEMARKLAHEKQLAQLAEETRLREEAAEKERRIRETFAEGERSLLEQSESQTLTFLKLRLSAHEGNEKKIIELEKQSARRRHELHLDAAKSEEDVIRANYRLERELRDIDFQEEMATESKKIEAARRAAQEKVDAERKAIDAIKALRDESGKNLFEAEMAKQSPQEVMDALIQKRMAESREQDPGMSRHRRQETDRHIRRQTARGLTQTGEQTSEAEIARVQSDLASKTILQADKQGKLNNETLKAFAEQARAMMDQTNFNEEISKQLEEVRKVGEGQRRTTREQTERLRAQRRAMRG